MLLCVTRQLGNDALKEGGLILDGRARWKSCLVLKGESGINVQSRQGKVTAIPRS